MVEEEQGGEQAGRAEERPGSAPSGAGTGRAPLPVGGPRPPSPGSDRERHREREGGGGMERGSDRSPAVLLQQETHHLLPLWACRGGSEDPRAQLNVLWLRALILKGMRNTGGKEKVSVERKCFKSIYLSVCLSVCYLSIYL